MLKCGLGGLGGEALHALLKRAHHRRVIHRRGELVHMRGSQHLGVRVLFQQAGQLFQMPRMRLSEIGAHVLVKLLVEFNVHNGASEHVRRLQQVQHAKLVVFELDDAMVRLVILIFVGDAGLVQQRLVVQQRHDGQ